MQAYLSIFKLRAVLQTQYRAAALAAFITNFFFGLVRVMVFQAFYNSGTFVQPMTLTQTVTYTWLTQVTFRMLPWTADPEMLALVRSGNVAYELCRPLNIYFSWYFRMVACRLVPALLTGSPIYFISILLPGTYQASLPPSLLMALIWLISLLTALFLSCAICNLITISALWTTAGDGMQRIFPALVMILSGTIIPLAFFPDWLADVLRVLPFAGLADLPTSFYLGLYPPEQILPRLGLQILWTVIFIFLGIKLLESGLNKVTLQGG